MAKSPFDNRPSRLAISAATGPRVTVTTLPATLGESFALAKYVHVPDFTV